MENADTEELEELEVKEELLKNIVLKGDLARDIVSLLEDIVKNILNLCDNITFLREKM